MTDLRIDGKSVPFEEGQTVLQVALAAGINITRLCSDESLKIHGNCGLCLVENEETRELVPACLTRAKDGLRVLTDTDRVRQAVKARAEQLFADHPNDCAVCPKAGDCVIQRICNKYRPELPLNKKNVRKRKLLDWIECAEEKCVKCGRCVSFLNKAGIQNDGAMPPVSCPPFPLSSTLIDKCPAAALTDASAAELWRPWEVCRIQTIDVTDCVGAKIYIDAADGQNIRVVSADPNRLISDKARFCLDGLRFNRLDRPYRRVGGQLKECSWNDALTAVAEKIKTTSPDRMAGLIGDYADCESMLALSDLFALKGAKAIDARPAGEMYLDTNSRQSYLFNTPFSRITEADAVLSVGAAVSVQAPAIGWLLRQRSVPMGFIGRKQDADLPYELLSQTPAVLKDILDGAGRGASLLRQAEKPMIIVGSSVMLRPDAAAVSDLIYRICQSYGVIREDWNGYNFLIDKTTVLGALELDLIGEKSVRSKIGNGEADFVYLLNEDKFKHTDAPGAFVIYQGIYASEAAKDADVVLPGLAFTEKRATYVNAEGRAQSTAVVSPPFGSAREDWKILRALSEHLETAPLPYNDLDGIRDCLAGRNVVFYERDKIHAAENTPFGTPGPLSDTPIEAVYELFDDELSRQSERARVLRWRSR